VRYIKTLVVWSQDGYHRPVALLHIQDDLLLGDIEHMNPVEALKDPPRRWVLGWIPFLIGIRLAGLLQALSNTPLKSRVDKKAGRLCHQKRHDPLLVLQVQRVGKKLSVLQKAKSPLD